MSENARIGESARYFVANQPMRYGIEIVYSLEVEHCTYIRDRICNVRCPYLYAFYPVTDESEFVNGCDPL